MKKQILIGAEFFEKVIEGNYFYIDKTLFIKELLENKGDVTLITRPRRFGKTMNMSMLQSFFDITKDSKVFFEGLKIMDYKELVEKHQNKYPVFFMTLKGINGRNFEESLDDIRIIISYLFRQNRYLYESDIFDEDHKKKYHSYLAETSSLSDLKFALRFLSESLYTYHKKRVIILLDEYDAPIDNSVLNGYYKEMIDFMRGFLGNVFKTNDFLEFGVLTGVQRISRESLLSSFNNPKICGILDKSFSTCFGFTESEVITACQVYGLADKFEKVKEWYNGYLFGEQQDMYNPWSITGFLSENRFKNYWVNTGGIDILSNIFFKGSSTLKDEIAGLLTDKPIKMKYVEHITYPIEYVNNDYFWSMLLNTGYIKPCVDSTENIFYAELVNLEIKNILSDCINIWFKRQQPTIQKNIQEFVEYLMNGDEQGVQTVLNEEILNNPSCHDFKEENSYHLFIFGILLAVTSDYVVYSNPESGKGRSDCLIKPNNKDQYAVVIEFKHCKSRPTLQDGIKGGFIDILQEEAQKGLDQIDEKAYIHNLKKEGFNKIYKYSIAFYQKNCLVMLECDEGI
ncbi:MAG: ATP-binding protein [Candidatus Cloacimonetes bacterium]|nr:ATP-binding protein [Candidatus Cloacimonadota bacterium]